MHAACENAWPARLNSQAAAHTERHALSDMSMSIVMCLCVMQAVPREEVEDKTDHGAEEYDVYVHDSQPLAAGEEKHMLSVFVADEKGLINRVAGVFARRGGLAALDAHERLASSMLEQQQPACADALYLKRHWQAAERQAGLGGRMRLSWFRCMIDRMLIIPQSLLTAPCRLCRRQHRVAGGGAEYRQGAVHDRRDRQQIGGRQPRQAARQAGQGDCLPQGPTAVGLSDRADVQSACSN